jgi:hypothetical protein
MENINLTNYSKFIFVPRFKTNIISIYNSDTNQIINEEINLGKFGYKLFGAVRAVTINKQCFISGGFNFDNNWSLIDDILLYSHSDKEIYLYNKLQKSRCCHGKILINDKIYFLGGCNENTCEILNLSTNSIKFMSNLNHNRAKPTSVYDITTNRLYIAGGDVDDTKFIESIEYLNLGDENSIWTEVKISNSKSLSFSNAMGSCLITVDKVSHLLLLGGADESENLSDEVNIVNLENFSLTYLTNLPFKDAFSQNPSFYQLDENTWANIGSYSGKLSKFINEFNTIKFQL